MFLKLVSIFEYCELEQPGLITNTLGTYIFIMPIEVIPSRERAMAMHFGSP
jgi:hypothetical protein